MRHPNEPLITGGKYLLPYTQEAATLSPAHSDALIEQRKRQLAELRDAPPVVAP